jgi:hypothetical protein
MQLCSQISQTVLQHAHTPVVRCVTRSETYDLTLHCAMFLQSGPASVT